MKSEDELREKLASLYFSSRNAKERKYMSDEIRKIISKSGENLGGEIEQLYFKITQAISKD